MFVSVCRLFPLKVLTNTEVDAEVVCWSVVSDCSGVLGGPWLWAWCDSAARSSCGSFLALWIFVISAIFLFPFCFLPTYPSSFTKTKQNKSNKKKKNTGHLWHRAAEHVEECACALAAVLAQSFTCSGSLIHLCCVAAQFSAASPRLFCGRLLSPAVCANQPRGSSRVLRGAEQAEGRLPCGSYCTSLGGTTWYCRSGFNKTGLEKESCEKEDPGLLGLLNKKCE